MSRILSFCWLSLLWMGAMGQSYAGPKDDVLRGRDSAYIADLSHLFSPRVIAVSKTHRISFRDVEGDRSLRYAPNTSVGVGVGFHYKWLGLNVTLPVTSSEAEENGHTDHFALVANSYGRKIGVDIYAQYYRGFFLNNVRAFEENWQGPPPLNSSMGTITLGGDFYYVFNHKRFSYRAAFLQNERQKKSAGSFILGGYVNMFSLGTDKPVLPPPLEAYFSQKVDVEKVATLNFGVQPGYAHSFVIRDHFFLTASLQFGLGVQLGQYKGRTDEEFTDYRVLTTKGTLRAAMGYNSDRFYTGLTMFSDMQVLHGTEGVSIERNTGIIKLFAGYRFSLARWKRKKS